MANLSNINNKFLVTTGGNVLIGRTSATGTSKLQVTGSLLIGTDISSGIPLVVQETTADGFAIGFMRNTNSTNGNGLVIDVNSTGGAYIQDWRQASTVKMRLLQNGNLGIGIDTPSSKLHVLSDEVVLGSVITDYRDLAIQVATPQETANSGTGISFDHGALGAAIASARVNNSTWGTDLRFYTHPDATTNQRNVTERMRIDSSGNVGIGTTDPLTTLHVNQPGDTQVLVQGTNKMALHQDAAWNSNILLGCYYDGSNIVYGSTNRGAFKIVGLHDSTTQPQTLSIYGANGALPAGSTVTFNSVGFSQDEDGNVGIGTTSPGYKLDVNGLVYFRTELYLLSTTARMYLGSGTGYCVINKGPGITGTATRLYFGEDADTGLTMFRGTGHVTVSSANVGIGNTSPTLGKLQVSGKGYFGPVGTGFGTTKPTMQSNAVLTLKPHDTNSTNMNFASVNGGAGIGIQTTNGPGTANWDIALSPFGGNVGIGMVQPAAKLDVVGSIAAGTRDGGVGYKNQLFQCSKTATGSNVGIDVMYVGHTNALNITVMCIIDGAQAGVGVGTVCVAYGSASVSLTSTRVSGNFISVSVAYINSGGSENYVLRVTPVYGGSSNPTIYLSAQGQSHVLLRTAV